MNDKTKVIGLNPETQKGSAKAWTKPATQELKENVVAIAAQSDIDVKEILDITGATPADIVDTLFMKILDGDLFKPEYKFYLTDILPKEIVRLGNKEYKYNELLGTSDTLDIQADNSIDDFNGDYVAEYAEVYLLDTPFHKKVKLPELVLSNAWAAAEGMVEFVQIQVEEMAYAIERRWENLAWTKLFAEAVALPVESTEAIEFSKALAGQMLEYGTTSDEHFGIGTNGSITIKTVNGDQTISPDLKFDASEFIVFVDTEQVNDETFINEAQWYNYLATKVAFGKVIPMAFSKYKGFKAITDSEGNEVAPAVTLPEGLRMVAMHKDSIELLNQYEYTQTLQGRGPWSITHNHKNLGTYRVKTKPIITVVEGSTGS